jgi:Ca2+-binding EF-hand superfamily protein
MRLERFFLCVAVGTLALTVASAGPAAEGKAASGKPSAESDPYAGYRRIFRRLDADGDGRVTEAEYIRRTKWPEEKARKIWRASDGDGDGAVTEAEYCENRRVTDKAKEVFAWLDADGDGSVTEAEAVAAARRVFAAMDADGSGKVNIPEFLGARWKWQVDVKWKQKPSAEGKPAGSALKIKPAPANCPACAMGLTAEMVFSRLDADGDKKVSVKEFARSPGMSNEAEARAAVGRIDTDADGSLSLAELAKAYKQRHAKCPKVDPTKAAAGGDGRGNRSRFAMVFMMRSDKNGDGVVDKSEFRGSDARFDQMDKNANGKLEPDELADLHNSRINAPKSMRERLDSGDLPRRPPWMGPDKPERPKDSPKPNADP